MIFVSWPQRSFACAARRSARSDDPIDFRRQAAASADTADVSVALRMALALGLYFGQARADVVRMGEQHIRDEVLLWVRQKTEGRTALELTIPVHPALRRKPPKGRSTRRSRQKRRRRLGCRLHYRARLT
jgi:integrase